MDRQDIQIQALDATDGKRLSSVVLGTGGTSLFKLNV